MRYPLTNGNYAEGVIVVDSTGSPTSSGGGSTSDASAANQLTQITKLTSIDGKLPALVSGRLPVDVQSLNVNVSNAQLEIANDVGNPIPVSGTVALSTGSSTIGSIANTGFTATQSGTWNINNIGGTVSLPTGAATSALQNTINTTLGTLATANNQTITNTFLTSIITNTGNIPSGLTVTSTRLLVESFRGYFSY